MSRRFPRARSAARRFTTAATGIAGKPAAALTGNTSDDSGGGDQEFTGNANEAEESDGERAADQPPAEGDVHPGALAEFSEFDVDELENHGEEFVANLVESIRMNGGGEKLDRLTGFHRNVDERAADVPGEPNDWDDLDWVEKCDNLAARIREHGDPQEDPYVGDESVGGMFTDGGESIGTLSSFAEAEVEGGLTPEVLAELLQLEVDEVEAIGVEQLAERMHAHVDELNADLPAAPDNWESLAFFEKIDSLTSRIDEHGDPREDPDDADNPSTNRRDDPSDAPVGALSALSAAEREGTRAGVGGRDEPAPASFAVMLDDESRSGGPYRLSPQQVRALPLDQLPSELASLERQRRGGLFVASSEAAIRDLCLLEDPEDDAGGADGRGGSTASTRPSTRRTGVNYAGRGQPRSQTEATLDPDDYANVGGLAALAAQERGRERDDDSR